MRATSQRRWTALAIGAALALTLSGCGEPVDGPLASGPDNPVATTAPSAHATPPTPSRAPQAPPRTSEPATPSVTQPPPSSPSTKPAAEPPATHSPTATSPSPSTQPTRPPRTSLQLGDRGEQVRLLQQQLSDLGYWLGEPDGHFGGLTQQAVFALQKAAGITRDGIVGPQTKAALAAATRPSSRVGGTGVEIDLTRQLLLVVREGNVVLTMNTSTGNGQEYVSRGTRKIARTPTGSFAVYRMVDATEKAELGELYRPMYFYGGYAVHGSSSIPAYPASHGCVRVSNSAMNMLWSTGYLAMGTAVTVYA